MRRLITTFAVGSVAALVLAGCGGGNAGVDWSSYDASVKARIDSLETAADCTGLQSEFDIADANDAVQRERTGTGNAELMTYLDDLMRDAGCYS